MLKLITGLLCSAALGSAWAQAAPMHGQFLPADKDSLRTEVPIEQQLLQVTHYSITTAVQRPSDMQPIPVVSQTQLLLKGQPLNAKASIVAVRVSFDGEGKSLKKPSFDSDSRTLSLQYPAAQYAVLLDLLRHERVYVQFLRYPNGHVWADVHTGTVKAR
ncbi:hypothetical protein [Atopomonas sediminilitoris]|uniref:hypothetical protein n=1 Tax=Atopomonas sediminilitoris TaxID=2919919 RepID=UPI001F4D7532|nr:hypothetical protein [Atopomonas sediminilitoris]MCJ8168748.1 hypothetical protein [Atopomonas sediminilitoris]